MMTGITILSGSAGVQTGPIHFIGMDKVGHFLIFGLLAISWIRFLEGWIRGPAKQLAVACLLVMAFGFLDEWHQIHNPDRYFEWADLGADLAGALILSAAFLYIPGFRRFLELEIWGFWRLILGDKAANSAG